MKKILFVGSDDFPIPAVRGGAIQNLVTSLVDENEIAHGFDCYVCSVYDYKNKDCVNHYKNTKFYFYKKNVFSKTSHFLNKILCKVTKYRFPPFNPYMRFVNTVVSKINPDIIVLETTFIDASQIFKNEKSFIFYHVHSDYLKSNTPYVNKIKNKVDCYIAVSDFIKDRLKEELSISDKNVVVLKNCTERIDIDQSEKKRIRQEVRERLNLEPEKTVFIYCGRLSKEKGCLELVKAFGCNSGYLIILGGSNFSSNKKTKYVKEIELEINNLEKKNVIMLGHIEKKDIYQYYYASDVGVVPSICNEAASLTALEMQMVGLPIIATNIGGIPEFTNASTTRYVELNENFVKNLSCQLEYFCNSDNLYKMNRIGKSDVKYDYKFYYNSFFAIIENIGH